MSNVELVSKVETQTNNEVKSSYSICTDKLNLSKLDTNGWVINNGNLVTDDLITIKGSDNQILAVVNAYAASKAKALVSIPQEKLTNSWFIDSIWISPNHPVSDAGSIALYFATKAARIYNIDIVLTIKDKNDHFPVMTIMGAKEIQNIDENKILVGQKVQYSLIKLAEQLPANSNDFVTQEFVNDMYKMFFTWYDDFNKGSWCNALKNKTLTRNQYISTLYNLHSYVKYTTRICARAVAHSDDQFLRNNYIDHFRGEINHEILIEKDLKNLGEDVDYLKNQYIPNSKTNAFRILQESTIGFYQDPVLLLACPFVAEGITANFKDELLDDLEATIKSWGMEKPDTAMRFINSHIKFDGGEDGHWEDVIKILPLYIKTEHDRQRFIAIARFGMESLYNSFNSNVEENLIW